MARKEALFGGLEVVRGGGSRSKRLRLREQQEEEGHVGRKGVKELCENDLEVLVEMVTGWMFGEEGLRREEIRAVVQQSWKECSEVFNEGDAVDWSRGEDGKPFHFPASAGVADGTELDACKGDLAVLVRRRQQRLAAERMSRERIAKVVGRDDPDRAGLLDIVDGMGIYVCTEGVNAFKPSAEPPPLRNKYKRVAPAVNKMIWELHEQGHVLLIPTEQARRIQGINFIAAHWAKKFKKRQGRPIIDPSKGQGMDGSAAVNSLEAKLFMKERWGAIEHPTIKDLVLMILEAADEHGWENITLWKADLKNAFGLMFVKPEHAGRLAVELTDGLTAIYITATFGFAGTPYSFAMITRVIERVAQQRIAGALKVYVDDGLGVCREVDAEGDKAKFYSICRGLLGPDAMADKYEKGRTLPMLGWQVDLNERTVSLADHNFHKTLHAFFQVEVLGFVSLAEMETLASLASRYALVARPMRPFVNSMHRCKASFSHKSGRCKLPQETIWDIYIWRAFLVLLRLRPTSYCRRLESFRSQIPWIRVRYDASLTGLGIVIELLRFGRVLKTLRVASIITPFDLQEQSKFQNCQEFFAVAVAFYLIARMGYKGVPILLVGDSVAAGTWCEKESFKSTVSRRAAIVYMMLGVHFDLWVQEFQHVEGEKNTLCDELSRRGESGQSALALAREWGFEEEVVWDEGSDRLGRSLLEACNPLEGLSSEEEFKEFWSNMMELVRGF